MRPRTFFSVTIALIFALTVSSYLIGGGDPTKNASDVFHRFIEIVGVTQSAGRPMTEGHEHITRIDAFSRLVVALVLSALIGAEREYQGKPAGLRTNTLVGLSACLMTISSVLAVDSFPDMNIDPTRIAGQIITGVGFLGAGAILRPALGDHIVGLTTAAALWLVCGLGIAVGLGYYAEAIVTTILVFVTLFALDKLECKIKEYAKIHPPKRAHGVDDASGHGASHEP